MARHILIPTFKTLSQSLSLLIETINRRFHSFSPGWTKVFLRSIAWHSTTVTWQIVSLHKSILLALSSVFIGNVTSPGFTHNFSLDNHRTGIPVFHNFLSFFAGYNNGVGEDNDGDDEDKDGDKDEEENNNRDEEDNESDKEGLKKDDDDNEDEAEDEEIDDEDEENNESAVEKKEKRRLDVKKDIKEDHDEDEDEDEEKERK
ncbi:hypothetical protein NC652_008195 [Populus alba x Populus x berolinensis]|nr:hypothetical protein NC652_008195 [Populus alba x Populus x berolinensis]